MAILRVGFFGAGLIAASHAAGLERAGLEHELVGVYDPDMQRRDAFAERWQVPTCDSEAEVYDRSDAVYVCTWTSEHARLVDEASRRGLAVFCEKPLAFDAATATAMTHAVEAAEVVNQVGLVLRYSPAFRLLADLVADPAAGRVMSVTFRDDQYIPVQGMYASSWRGDRTKAGSGTLLEHSIHDVDILEHCIGPVASVSARSANFHGLDGIEDAVATVLQFESGAVGVHTTIWHDVLERPSLRRVEVFCERRHIVVENDALGPMRWQTTGEAEVVVEGDALLAVVAQRALAAGRNQDRAFLHAVVAGTTASPSFADAVRAHRVVDAIYASSAAGGAPTAIG